MKKLLPLILVTALSLTACTAGKANRPDSQPVDGPSRSMIGLDDEPLTDDWKAWTPTASPVTPGRIAEIATAFDYWQLTDRTYLEKAWAALSAVLGDVRSNAGDEYAQTFRMLMTVLEPDMADGARHFDLTFFASKLEAESAWEGIGARVWRELPSGATPVVSVLLRRSSGGAEAPADIFLWFASDFEEAPSLTLRLRNSAGTWTTQSAAGISFAASEPFDGETSVLASILTQTFWAPFTGPGYVETMVEHREGDDVVPTALPPSFGAALGDRDIDQVFSDSVFPPRFSGMPTN